MTAPKMLKKIIPFLLSFASLMGQVDWFGYFESEGDLGGVPDQTIFYGYHKLRLDLDSSPSKDIRIGADIICKQYYGKTHLNFLDFLAPAYHPIVPNQPQTGWDTLAYLPYILSDTLFIDNMFLEFHHRYFDLTLGKQQLATGVGYAWNPTDIFNLKDLLDPTYENTGITAIRLSIPLGLRTTLSGIVRPANSWNETIQYYEMKSGIGRFDAAVLYSRSQMNLSGLTGTIVHTHDLYGFNLEGDLLGAGIRSEFAAHRLDFNQQLQYEYIVGGDYTFTNSLYCLAEFYHNDLGAETTQTGIDDYLFYYSGERKSLNQNYLFLLAMYPLGNLLDLSAFAIFNLDDQSAIIAPQIVYRIFRDVEISFLASRFIGDSLDEFGYQQYGIRLRLRAYF